MNVLIVGATSMIGKALAVRLAATGNRVRRAGRRDADVFFDLTQWLNPPEVRESFDVVVHAAADFGGPDDQDAVRAEVVNAAGTLAVCALAKQVQARQVVLLSSLSATYQAGDAYFGIYALSKRHGEELARWYCQDHTLGLSILRPSQVYDDQGAGRRHQNLFYAVVDHAEAGDEILFHGTRDARRNYIHLDDLAEVVLRVIQQRRLGGFVCAHPRSVCLSELAKAAYAAYGSDRDARFLPDKPALADLPEIHDFQIYGLIGYSPRIDVEEGYMRIRAYREGRL
ncbi:MAG TPA: NAD(P)-dependent oxidoreductase [Nitrosomonas europaea]|uniref:NAD-dependent epimerase/dehydratase family protein n=1 Tax=Betaproteobacteria TaxID=28216 RepID=UPI002CE4AE67|nr:MULTISPECIES: NAD(P)-dependent oxidoreductase [Betaproteobacteria]HRO22600.1 NAD(P)-dependent oxidoreductase [Alcaligenes phenolicus]HUM74980.1 NAD(P)-dependent oxidoreductase [Nitrosomonas europaea]